MELYERLTELRKKAGFSQEKLAEMYKKVNEQKLMEKQE